MTPNPFASADDQARKYSEYKLHVATLKHVYSAFIGSQNPNLRVFHYPAETRDATDAFFKKQMGVEPGFSDLIFGWRKGGHAQTGVLEIKTPAGKMAASQNRFLSWARLIGWHTGVSRTVLQAHTQLCSWGLVAIHQEIVEPDYRGEQEKFKDSFDFFAGRAMTAYTPPDEASLTAMVTAQISAVQYGRQVPLGQDERQLIAAAVHAMLVLCRIELG